MCIHNKSRKETDAGGSIRYGNKKGRTKNFSLHILGAYEQMTYKKKQEKEKLLENGIQIPEI